MRLRRRNEDREYPVMALCMIERLLLKDRAVTGATVVLVEAIAAMLVLELTHSLREHEGHSLEWLRHVQASIGRGMVIVVGIDVLYPTFLRQAGHAPGNRPGAVQLAREGIGLLVKLDIITRFVYARSPNDDRWMLRSRLIICSVSRTARVFHASSPI